MLTTVIAEALYYFLPGFVANMCPVIFGGVAFLQPLKKPIDGGKKLFGKRLFGDHKTYLGFVAGCSGALFIGCVQTLLYDHVPLFQQYSLLPYQFPSSLLLSFSMGFGALCGDLLKSFIKRRFGKPDGSSFFPFDQLDFVFGGILFAGLVGGFPSVGHLLVLVLLTPLLHFLSNVLGYKLGLKKVWW